MGNTADSQSDIPPGTYEMVGPMMHLFYDERGEALRGFSDHEKEELKRVILEHDAVFRGQVNELHRLWRRQRELMLEFERNPFQTNSSSSPIPPQHSTNEKISVFDSNQHQPNFEFIREGSAQSSANVAPSKKPMFDLRLPASDYVENENGMENGFGVGNGAIFYSGEGSVVSSANGTGTGTRERILVTDLNEPVDEMTGLDFLGVSRDPVRDRLAEERSSLGLFSVNRKIANEGLSLEKEKGGSSSGVNLFYPDSNHRPNFNSGNFPGISFFAPYRSHQNSFQDQHAFVPEQFGQKLTFSFDPSQGQSTHIFSSRNSNNNDSVAPTSFPVLDSGSHYNNLNKNKSLVVDSLYPLNPFFNNGSGTAVRATGDSSGFYLDAPRNPAFGSSGGQSFDFSKSICEKNSNLGTTLNLNEPIPEETQEIKGIKLFGSNCRFSISETDGQRSKINLNETANKDELSQKASCSVSGVAGEPNSSNIKLLGFPVFGTPNKSTSHKDESNKSERRVDFEHAEPTKRAVIDLNEDLPIENNLDFSKESNNDKNARYLIDLEMPASDFEEPDIGMQQDETEKERESGPELSVIEAATNIVAISKLKISPEPPPTQSNELLWFADLAVSGCDKLSLEPESSSEDLFELMTLKLEEVKSDDQFGTGKFCEKKIGESSSQAGEMGYGSLLFTRGRRGPARKRRQKRDFQRDVLPTIASLSRVEVTEDLQMIGGLMKACGQEFEMVLTRRAGRSSSSVKGKRRKRSPQVNPSERNPHQMTSPQRNPSQGDPPQVKPSERTPPHNPHVNPPQRSPKESHQQRIPPLVSQPNGSLLMGPPMKVSLDNQHLRTAQSNQPQKITLMNQVRRSAFLNQRQRTALINSSQKVLRVHQQHGGAEMSRSDMAVAVNQRHASVQNYEPQRNVQVGQSGTGAQASVSKRIPVANPQQTVNQNSDMEGDGLSVIGWGRTTARRNRRPRSLPPTPQQ